MHIAVFTLSPESSTGSKFSLSLFTGIGAAEILKGVMELFPLDQYVDQPVRTLISLSRVD